MKKIKLALAAAFFLGGSAAMAQFTIAWWEIAGGGGASGGGGFALSGTIGQHDDGSMNGGSFTLTSGSWVGIMLVQTAGAPRLTLKPAGAPGQAILSWSPDTAGYHLQESATLAPARWTNSLSGTNHPVSVLLQGQVRYFRLIAP